MLFMESFFGYNCIGSVKLKIVQNKLEEKAKVYPQIKDLTKIEEKMKKVDNENLKSSLNNFLKAYNEKSK